MTTKKEIRWYRQEPSLKFWGTLAALGLINIVSISLLKETSVSNFADAGVIGVALILLIGPFSAITAAFMAAIVEDILTFSIIVWVFMWFRNKQKISKMNKEIESPKKDIAISPALSKASVPYKLLHRIRIYAPDLLIQFGVYLYLVNVTKVCHSYPSSNPLDAGTYINTCSPNWHLIVPIILITIGANIAIRRYIVKVRPK